MYRGQTGIKDPQIIADCGKRNLTLLTADSDLETRWAPEIQRARISVVVLANNADGATAWGARLAKGKKDIEARLRQYPRPCVLRFGINAKVTHVRLYGPKRGRLIKI